MAKGSENGSAEVEDQAELQARSLSDDIGIGWLYGSGGRDKG